MASALRVAALALLTALTAGQVHHNASELVPVVRGGKTVLMPPELLHRLQEEETLWHWTPWLATRMVAVDNRVDEVECVDANSVDSFPESIFNDDQLRMGGFILYVVFGMYAFTLLAYICNDYFVPTVEIICEVLNIPQNVAAATFMSVATSCPEFFVNVISTFMTGSDMGIGTIIGSALFNCLGVAAIGSIAAIRPIKIEVLPVTRDVLIYMVNVSVLVIIVWDGQITQGEAWVLAVLYILYFVLMFNSIRLFGLIEKLVSNCCNRKTIIVNDADTENYKSDPTAPEKLDEKKMEDDELSVKKSSIFSLPRGKPWWKQLWWVYSWPLRFLLAMTVPSPISHRKYFPVTFIMCIVWIGVNSYFVSWSMTIIGHTFLIPDSVMGMTFLAFGGCLPEACSIYIMSRRGEGGMGVSNALGANSLAILFALGIPWLIKTLALSAQGAVVQVVYINSAGIDFVVGSLLIAVSCMWISLCISKFTLRKTLGAVLLVLYLIFVTFAILVEMGIILDRGLSTC